MADLHAHYYRNSSAGIHKWNGGEGSKLDAECKAVPRVRPDPSDPAVARALAAGKGEWGGAHLNSRVVVLGSGEARL